MTQALGTRKEFRWFVQLLCIEVWEPFSANGEYLLFRQEMAE
jgi:hypothetical protein